MNYLTNEIHRLLSFDFYRNNYYYFTIKFNKPYLFDNAVDLVTMIDYMKMILINSTISKLVYCFELDSKGHLHIHGICATTDRLVYKYIYRLKGVHHKFSFIEPPTWHSISKVKDSEYIKSMCKYMLKDMLGSLIIKQFKENYLIRIRTKAYWY